MNDGRRFRRFIHVLTCSSQDKEGSTVVLLDDDSPLVQSTIHDVVGRQLERELLLSSCPITQEGIYLLQKVQGLVSAVTTRVTRERARPSRNSTRAARD